MTPSACAKAPVIFGLALVAIISSSTFAADQPPNIKGKWVGKTHSIVAGSGGHWPTSKGTFEKPGLFEKDLVIEVTGQEGRRFWGIQTISGSNGESTQEPMIGELTGRDNRTVVIVLPVPVSPVHFRPPGPCRVVAGHHPTHERGRTGLVRDRQRGSRLRTRRPLLSIRSQAPAWIRLERLEDHAAWRFRCLTRIAWKERPELNASV
jgi:hypothetical protein